MKYYISIKKMTFDEDNIEREIVLNISDNEFYGYDYIIDKPEGFTVREENTWNSFPLYEIINGKIADFDYTQYQYFLDTDRRIDLSIKINQAYNVSSELKILRKTIKHILDHVGLVDADFLKYNEKVVEIIEKNPKELIDN